MTWLRLLPSWLWWLAALVVVGGVQQYRVMDAQSDLSDARLEWSNILRKTAEANAAVILSQQQESQALAAELASLDEQRYGELRHAQENTDRLAGELASARSRLRVRIDPTSCPAVPATAHAASVDAGTVFAEIHGETAAAIVRITGDADQCAVKLSALQDWARSVTRGN